MAAGLVALETAAADRAGVGASSAAALHESASSRATDPAEATALVHGDRCRGARGGRRADPLPRDRAVGCGLPPGGVRRGRPGRLLLRRVLARPRPRGSDTDGGGDLGGPGRRRRRSAVDRRRWSAAGELADRLCGDGRVLIQGHAVPDVGPLDAALGAMADVAAAHDSRPGRCTRTRRPAGSSTTTIRRAPQVGAGVPRAVRDAGVPIVAVHKGLSGGNPFASPVDIGPAAAANPDLAFLVYHSGYETASPRGRTTPTAAASTGWCARSPTPASAPGGNVYAELGSTWRAVMGEPDEAAHVLGKLLVAFGADRILWGTDSIWYGSPQDQIDAFRAFEITPEFQERFGYPALTPEVKQRILGRQRRRAVRRAARPRGLRSRRGPAAGRSNGPRARSRRRDVAVTFRREHPWIAAR